MQDEHYNKIKESAWRRALSRDEEAALQQILKGHPEARQEWAEETALNRLMERLPTPVVSSNFTGRVLAAAQKAPAQPAWREWFDPSLWFPESTAGRLAVCSMIVCIGLISFHESEVIHRAKMAHELAGVSRMAALPPVEWLKDFDTINGINKVKVADDDLLVALQ